MPSTSTFPQAAMALPQPRPSSSSSIPFSSHRSYPPVYLLYSDHLSLSVHLASCHRSSPLALGCRPFSASRGCYHLPIAKSPPFCHGSTSLPLIYPSLPPHSYLATARTSPHRSWGFTLLHQATTFLSTSVPISFYRTLPIFLVISPSSLPIADHPPSHLLFPPLVILHHRPVSRPFSLFFTDSHEVARMQRPVCHVGSELVLSSVPVPYLFRQDRFLIRFRFSSEISVLVRFLYEPARTEPRCSPEATQGTEMDSWEALDLDDSDLLLSGPLPRSISKRSSSPDRSQSPHRHQKQKLHLEPPTQTHPISLLQPCSQIPRPSPPPSRVESSTRDFPSHSLPTTTAPVTTTNAKRLVPGPAGAVQAAMHRLAVIPPTGSQPALQISQENDQCDDEDFKRSPWLCALEFIGRGSDSAAKSHMLCSITDSQTTQRVPLVAGIIKSCKPNGLGDLIVSLKDPSGTIDATIHRKVVCQSKFSGQIAVGSVLVLQQVVVFPTFRSAHYLNITLNNVVKVFGKDISLFSREKHPAFHVSHADSETRTGVANVSNREGLISTQTTKAACYDAKLVGKTLSDTVAGTFNCCSSSFEQGLTVKTANVKIHQGGDQISVTEAPHTNWTDEQINEVFADIEDW